MSAGKLFSPKFFHKPQTLENSLLVLALLPYQSNPFQVLPTVRNWTPKSAFTSAMIVQRLLVRLCTRPLSSHSVLFPQRYVRRLYSTKTKEKEKESNGEFPAVPPAKKKISRSSIPTSTSLVVDKVPKKKKKDKTEAFYIVQKGNVTGIYRNYDDCRSMVLDPACVVFKGYSMQKKVEELLASRGLMNALYSISTLDIMSEVFGEVVPCEDQDVLISQIACLMEFDGASKGNPGRGGAGVVLRSLDGTIICRLIEGLGNVTCNIAEYRALILGMRYALKKGINQIQIQGDSKLVCKQLLSLWKVKAEHLIDLSNEAKELMEKFLSFQIKHVPRALNSEADALANDAVELGVGQVMEL